MKKTSILYSLVWVVPIIAVSLYEAGLIEGEGCLADNANGNYLLSTASVFLTLGVIYAGLKMFAFKPIAKSLATLEDSKARSVYSLWINVRSVALCLTTLLDLLTYFTTLSNSGLYCALIMMISSVFCYPSESGFKALRNREEKEK